jgi:hypothetical protein
VIVRRFVTTPVRALLAALALGTVLATGCAAHSAPAQQATPSSCYDFGVRALRQHVTVTTRPAACAGLSQQVINDAVSRAIRDVVAGLAKAPARKLADKDSRYLAALVHPVPAGPPAAATAGPAARASVVAARLAALAAWIVTAAAGAYLLAGLLGSSRPWKWKKPDVVAASHASLALTGLAVWIAYVVTVTPALSWIALGLTFVIAGLGMATLLGGPSDPGDLPAPEAPPDAAAVPQAAAGVTSLARVSPPVARGAGRAPAYVIAAHGVFATATILLVLLAAIGAG